MGDGEAPLRPALADAIRSLDAAALERLRSDVKPADVPALAAFYRTRDRWEERCALVDLVQDRPEPALRPMFEDVLRCPVAGEDWSELAQAAALARLHPEEDRFSTYLRDRAVLRRDVDAALARLGATRDAPRPARAPPPAPPPTSAAHAAWLDAGAGRTEALLARLAAGLSPDTTWEGDPLLCRALLEGRGATASALLAAGARADARRAVADQPALWWAATHGLDDVVDELLRRGAPVDAADAWGATPLLQAAVHGRPGALRRLLAAGADPDRRTKDGRSPLHFSVRGGSVEAAALLLDAGVPVDRPSNGFTPLLFACFEGTAELVRLFLERGADPDARITFAGLRRGTPLMLAARAGQVRMVAALLKHGADPGLRDGEGRTAADLAGTPRAARIRELLAAAPVRAR